MSDTRDSRQWADDCQRWRGEMLTGVLSHWCWDWDGLPVDETMPEIECCTCDLSDLIANRIVGDPTP